VSHETTDEAMAHAAQAFLDAALSTSRDERADESFVLCAACGEVDSHESGCPVIYLERFLRAGALVEPDWLRAQRRQAKR